MEWLEQGDYYICSIAAAVVVIAQVWTKKESSRFCWRVKSKERGNYTDRYVAKEES